MGVVRKMAVQAFFLIPVAKNIAMATDIAAAPKAVK
jgi:hypothetical protein